MQVTTIWRYPVKSLGGERLTSATVGANGIEFDRAWGVYDPATEMVLTARREPALLFLSAAVVEGQPVITCDEGSVMTTDADLSNWFGRPVEIRAATAGPGTFENPMNAEDETDWVTWQSVGDTFHDGASKISLAANASYGDWDPRRFRINLTVDAPHDDVLTGEITVGSVTLRARKPISRCVMVSRAQPGLPKDIDVLKAIIAERANQLGVGAVVTSAGVIAVGDPVITSP